MYQYYTSLTHANAYSLRAIFPAEFSKQKFNESISAAEKKDLSFNAIGLL